MDYASFLEVVGAIRDRYLLVELGALVNGKFHTQLQYLHFQLLDWVIIYSSWTPFVVPRTKDRSGNMIQPTVPSPLPEIWIFCSISLSWPQCSKLGWRVSKVQCLHQVESILDTETLLWGLGLRSKATYLDMSYFPRFFHCTPTKSNLNIFQKSSSREVPHMG